MLGSARCEPVCSAIGPSAEEMLRHPTDSPGTRPDAPYELVIRRSPSLTMFSGKDRNGHDKSEAGVVGVILLNGKEIGSTVENAAHKIPAGDYPGVLRYFSQKHFVQGPLGQMGTIGDFLLEIGSVDKRYAILIHGGTKPWHTQGCILVGAVHFKKAAEGKIQEGWVEENETLRILRKEFYGTDLVPRNCPNKSVRVKVFD